MQRIARIHSISKPPCGLRGWLFPPVGSGQVGANLISTELRGLCSGARTTKYAIRAETLKGWSHATRVRRTILMPAPPARLRVFKNSLSQQPLDGEAYAGLVLYVFQTQLPRIPSRRVGAPSRLVNGGGCRVCAADMGRLITDGMGFTSVRRRCVRWGRALGCHRPSRELVVEFAQRPLELDQIETPWWPKAARRT